MQTIKVIDQMIRSARMIVEAPDRAQDIVLPAGEQAGHLDGPITRFDEVRIDFARIAKYPEVHDIGLQERVREFHDAKDPESQRKLCEAIVWNSAQIYQIFGANGKENHSA